MEIHKLNVYYFNMWNHKNVGLAKEDNIFFFFFFSKVELSEIESSCEEYPLTRAFCDLISTMVECSLPVNLGAGLRVPGFQPYLDFLRDSVFLPFPTRAYRRPAEKVKGKMWLRG